MHGNLDGQMTQIDEGTFGKLQAQPLAVRKSLEAPSRAKIENKKLIVSFITFILLMPLVFI